MLLNLDKKYVLGDEGMWCYAYVDRKCSAILRVKDGKFCYAPTAIPGDSGWKLDNHGVRPVVCLNSDVNISIDGNIQN